MNNRFLSVLSIVLLGVMTFSLVGSVQPVEAASVCNAAQFVADVTIPDGTYINPGSTFVKTWRIKNVGTCAWSTSYSLVFANGEPMNGASPIFMPRYIGPGMNVDLSVKLTAPTAGGTYRSYWQPQSGTGAVFG